MIRDMISQARGLVNPASVPRFNSSITHYAEADGDFISAGISTQDNSASVRLINDSPYLLITDSPDGGPLWQGYGSSVIYSRCIRPFSELVNFGAWSNPATTGPKSPQSFSAIFRLAVYDVTISAAKEDKTILDLFMGKPRGNEAEQWSSIQKMKLSAHSDQSQEALFRWFDTNVGLGRWDSAKPAQKWRWTCWPDAAKLIGYVFILLEGPRKVNDNETKATYQTLALSTTPDAGDARTESLLTVLYKNPDAKDVRSLFNHTLAGTKGISIDQILVGQDASGSYGPVGGEQSKPNAQPVNSTKPDANLFIRLTKSDAKTKLSKL
jgi:hypothetical protein